MTTLPQLPPARSSRPLSFEAGLLGLWRRITHGGWGSSQGFLEQTTLLPIHSIGEFAFKGIGQQVELMWMTKHSHPQQCAFPIWQAEACT